MKVRMSLYESYRLFGRIFLRYALLKPGMKSNSARLFPWEHGTPMYPITAVTHLENHCWLMPLERKKKVVCGGDLPSLAYSFPTASPLDGFSTFRRMQWSTYQISWNTRNDKSFKLTRDCVIDLSIIVTPNNMWTWFFVLSDCELISRILWEVYVHSRIWKKLFFESNSLPLIFTHQSIVYVSLINQFNTQDL